MRSVVVATTAMVALLHCVTFGQVFNEPAPPGNLDAIELVAGTTVGSTALVTIMDEPGAVAYVVVAEGAANFSQPSGQVLIDPGSHAFVFVENLTGTPVGTGSVTFMVPVLAPGTGIFVQAGLVRANGSSHLTNRCALFVTEPASAPLGLLTLDPVTSPTAQASVTLTGSAAAPGSEIIVTGGATTATTTSGTGTAHAFSLVVPLNSNRANDLLVTEVPVGSPPLPPVPLRVVQDGEAPEVFIDFPSSEAVLTTAATTVAGRVSDRLSGFMGLDVEVNGLAGVVNIGIGTNGTFEVTNVPLEPVGTPTTLTVTATDTLGNQSSQSIVVFQDTLSGIQLTAVSGGGEEGPVGQVLESPLRVRVTDESGQPFANKTVTFEVTRSNGRLAGTATATSGAMLFQTPTDSQGFAAAYWTLGSDAGCGNNRVAVTSEGVSGTVFFCATATARSPVQINLGSGNGQSGPAGALLSLPLRVWLSDTCNGAAHALVSFSVVSGDAFLVAPGVAPSPGLAVLTSATGHAEVGLHLGFADGPVEVRADFPGNPGGPVTFRATSHLSFTGVATSFSGLVLSNARAPIEGATCTLNVGGQQFTDISDEHGFFLIEGVTAFGPGKLEVAGETATAVGRAAVVSGTFPHLAYLTNVVEGADNSLPSPVLLPRLEPVRFAYRKTQPTILTIPGIDGLTMTVHPNSMFIDGQPAEQKQPITLSQVHADDIPMPMPDGNSPPFAWTLQPHGATFVPPISVSYPNMSGLPAGSVAYFLSYDHDVERFDIVATGTVNADGSQINTDEGDGIGHAGWGCNCPPYSVATDCEGCSTTHQRGSISPGTISVSPPNPMPGQTVIVTISGAMDSGGSKTVKCPNEPAVTTPIATVPVSHSWVLTTPGGVTTSGGGGTITIPNATCGLYSVSFTGSANRECPPSPFTLGRTVNVTTSGNMTQHQLEVSVSMDPWRWVNNLLPGNVSGSTGGAFQWNEETVCCPNGTNLRAKTNGQVNAFAKATGTLEGGMPIPVPLIGAVSVCITGSAAVSVDIAGTGLTYDPCTQEWTGNFGMGASGTIAAGLTLTSGLCGVESTQIVNLNGSLVCGISGSGRLDAGNQLKMVGEVKHTGLLLQVTLTVEVPFTGYTYTYSYQRTLVPSDVLWDGCWVIA